MNLLGKALVAVALLLAFEGCSQKTDFRVMTKPQDKAKRYSSASVLVTVDEVDSIDEGDEGVIEYLEEEITDKLADMGIKFGSDLLIKVRIDHYEEPCFVCTGGITAIDANVILSSKKVVVSEFEIKYRLNDAKLSSTFVFTDAKEAFVKKLMEHLKENFLKVEDN